MRRVVLVIALPVAAAALAYAATQTPAGRGPNPFVADAPAATVASSRLPAVSERIVDYRIDGRLDAVRKQLTGHERVVWRNPSSEPVGDLWFHLYLNAFKNTDSTFMRESGGQLRGDRMVDGKWGWIDVTSIALAEETMLDSPAVRESGGPKVRPDDASTSGLPDYRTSGRRDLTIVFEHPDDDNAEDRTVARVVLPQAVPPGATVALDISFRAQLPQVFARSGYVHDYYLVGQWFPKLGVYEPAGMRGRQAGGWNCHQYHANSEFYADYGHFLVNITVPSRFVVGATGERVARRDNRDGTTVHTFEQADVHDFAWTADPNFVEMKRTFSALHDVTEADYRETARRLDRSMEDVRLSDVDVTLLLQPQHVGQSERHFAAAFAGIRRFGLWYGRYPYRTLTVVDPAYGAMGSGGMEYPTFITAGTSILADYWPFKDNSGPEGVTVHEFGHQFWYGMVGNNEFEEAWLDEGIDSYSTGRVMEAEFGQASAALPFVQLSESDILGFVNTPDTKFNAILRPAWGYLGDYSFYAYAKPEIVLRTLENLIGRDTMARVMRTYQERWRFRHPCSQDFFAVASEISGRNLSSFFDQTIKSSDVLDYEVESVRSVPAEPTRGVVERDGKRAALDSPAKQATKPRFDTTVIVRRRGEVVLPVDVAFKFEGKPVERQVWDGRERFVRYTFTRPERLEWAAVDPDRKLELDVDSIDNSRTVKADERVPVKWTATLLFIVQNILSLAGV